MEQEFYLEKPRPMGWRGWSLLLPSIVSAIGFTCFASIGFGFVEMDALGAGFRQTVVLLGAFSLAIGGEMGTVAQTVELFRKRDAARAWDWAGLVISVLASLSAFILAFAALLGVRATWGATVQMYGPIVLGCLAALDAYGGFMSTGLYLATFDERMNEWRAAYERFSRGEWTRERKRQDAADLVQPFSTEQKQAFPMPVEQAREHRKMKQDERRAALVDIWQDEPDAGATELAERLNVGRTTIYADIGALEQAGVIHRNGDGVQVVERGNGNGH